METIAVISDIHANPYALQRVLDDIRRKGITRIFCLGDIVGYNALPRETLHLLRKAGIPTVKGNHDMIAAGELPIENCGPIAKSTLSLARTQLTEEERQFLRGLPGHLNPEPHILMLHSRWGNAVDYLRTPDDFLEEYHVIRAVWRRTRFCFTGHTHGAGVVEITTDERVQERTAAAAAFHPDHFYFINPGSVGHPRRSDYRATYTIFNPAAHSARFMRVPYPKRRMALVNTQHRIATDLGRGRFQFALETIVLRVKAAARSIYVPKSVGYRSRPASRPGGYPRPGP